MSFDYSTYETSTLIQMLIEHYIGQTRSTNDDQYPHGVMYYSQLRAVEDELNRRIPASSS